MGSKNFARLCCFFGAVAFELSALVSIFCVIFIGFAAAAEDRKNCTRVVKADVVAIEQAYLLNRFSAFVPAGMLYALKRDVVDLDGGSQPGPGNAMLRPDKRPRPIVLRVNEGDCLELTFTNWLSKSASDESTFDTKGMGIPREYRGLLPNHVMQLPGSTPKAGLSKAEAISVDMPRTRAASFHISGLEVMSIDRAECPVNAACGGDGSNVGLPGNQGVVFNTATSDEVKSKFLHGSLAQPGQTVVTLWRAGKDGAYFAYSMGAPVGGEGDGGQIGLGLFGSVNVEPAGSRWYRSQVKHDVLSAAKGSVAGKTHPYATVNYETEDASGTPVFNMLDPGNNIVHTDLNAIIVPPSGNTGPEACAKQADGSNCGKPFREFTAIFHDEVHAQQAFAELEDENNPLHLIKDGMGINYGVSSMGSLVMSTPRFKKNVGPVKDCPECRAEEFFLSSWANGDPALLLKYDDTGKAIGALYPDDPSNVHHSYLGDNVRFRNLHAGPKETHVFHLHAHQWMSDRKDPNASYLDSQTISPGATFSYDIEFGGSGNRNYTPGDSIFHCHLYPHFAQGMWELWRTHDAFSDGKVGWYDASKPVTTDNDPASMNLPDAEIETGTETPAIVPIPGAALAPMPVKEFRGYPFYIPGSKGHRPPQPAFDFDVDAPWTNTSIDPPGVNIIDGGLPRHIVSSGKLDVSSPEMLKRALKTGGDAAQVIAQRVATQDPKALAALAGEWEELEIKTLNLSGTEDEKAAMKFHAGTLSLPDLSQAPSAPIPHDKWWKPKAYVSSHAATVDGQDDNAMDPAYFYVNGRQPAQGAPYADPCPAGAPVRDYRTAFIQTELTYNKHGWFDPQGRILVLENDIKEIIDPDTRTRLPAPLFFRANSGECINFKSSNFIPSALNVDDFQIFTPTDTIGQHIHLVKFDVTSSDGSGNGFNYEDATYSPQEVRERLLAYNLSHLATPSKLMWPKTHPLFRRGGDIYEAAQREAKNPAGSGGYSSSGYGEKACADAGPKCIYGKLLKRGTCGSPPQVITEAALRHYFEHLQAEHPFCGAQRTTQRWWADPILNSVSGKDNTLRTVFTHDHMGPSSHQQHGLYAGLVIEPANSVWTKVGSSISSANLGQMNAEKLLEAGVLGGSDLSRKTETGVNGSLVASVMPRPPLKLRSDGGPTSTMANIIAPACIGDSNSNPKQPTGGRNPGSSGACRKSNDSRREFDLAIADFGIAYNMALEPINPENFGDNGIRDTSAIRFGRRHVPQALARPLAISSEDPGSQYFNYRHEPLALRISEASPDPVLGGWNYSQNTRRAIQSFPCTIGAQDCLGDTANAFSTAVHAKRDEMLAKNVYPVIPVASTMNAIKALPEPEQVAAEALYKKALASVENWRRRFNCALYSRDILPNQSGCDPRIEREEPWRQFGDPATPILPAYEGDRIQIRLIQGAQEAQHIFTMNGVKWHRLPGGGNYDKNGNYGENNSGYVNAQPVGISEHFEFDLTTQPLDSPLTDYLFYGSSIDQLWDGMWGLMRVYSDRPVSTPKSPLVTSSSTALRINPPDFLAKLPDRVASEVGGEKDDPCQTHDDAYDKTKEHQYFEISAVRVCDLYGTCGQTGQHGITYNKKLGIEDLHAVAYVLEREPQICTISGSTGLKCENMDDQYLPNASALNSLRSQFIAGRPLEPLVLRASAGQCLDVQLRNLLPPVLPGFPIGPDGKTEEVLEKEAFYNFLPMITDGFNINQFRMSPSVGISPARVFQHPSNSDGSNAGLNGAVNIAYRNNKITGNAFLLPYVDLPMQGSLVPPCTGNAAIDNVEEGKCREKFIWSATDFLGTGADFNKPVEYGAVPLRSFGDPIKQPAHGMIGALIIGPRDSHICGTKLGDAKPNRFAKSINVPGVGDIQINSRPSAVMCRPGGYYIDHALILQDAISATWRGLPVENLAGAEEPDDYGVKGLNYKTDPLWGRSGGDPSVGFTERNAFDLVNVLSSRNGDPEVPVLQAAAGETVRLHFVHSGGHTRQQGLAISGHNWNPYPWANDSHVLKAASGSSIRQGVFNGFGPMMGISLELTAGGESATALDYLIRSQASFLFDGGIWAIFRVEPKK